MRCISENSWTYPNWHCHIKTTSKLVTARGQTHFPRISRSKASSLLFLRFMRGYLPVLCVTFLQNPQLRVRWFSLYGHQGSDTYPIGPIGPIGSCLFSQVCENTFAQIWLLSWPWYRTGGDRVTVVGRNLVQGRGGGLCDEWNEKSGGMEGKGMMWREVLGSSLRPLSSHLTHHASSLHIQDSLRVMRLMVYERKRKG